MESQTINYSASVLFQQPDEEVDERWVALLALSNKLAESPVDRHLLLQVSESIHPALF